MFRLSMSAYKDLLQRSVTVAVATIFIHSSAFAETTYLGLFGGSTIDGNNTSHEDDAQLFFNTLQARGSKPIMAFSSGPIQVPVEGYISNYKDTLANEFLPIYESIPGQERRYKSRFKKDFDGDGKSDVEFAGTSEGIDLALENALAKVKPGDRLSIQISDHGNFNDVQGPSDYFNTANYFTPFINMYDTEYYSLPRKKQIEIDSYSYDKLEKKIRKNLPEGATVYINAKSCFSGGVHGISGKGICTTSATTGNAVAVGYPLIEDVAKPPSPYEDLRSFTDLGYWHHFDTYLKDHVNASPKEAFFHALFNDIVNTPMSSSDVPLYEYFNRTQQKNKFDAVFGRMQKLKLDITGHIKSPLGSPPCELSSAEVRLPTDIQKILAAVQPWSLPPARRKKYIEYKAIADRFERIEGNPELNLAKKRLTALLKSENETFKKRWSMPVESAITEGHQDFDQFYKTLVGKAPPAIFSGKKFDEKYIDLLNAVKRIDRLANQLSSIETHQTQLKSRLGLYIEFIAKASSEEFKKFSESEKCLETKF